MATTEKLNAPAQQRADRAKGAEEREKMHKDRRREIAKMADAEVKALAKAEAAK